MFKLNEKQKEELMKKVSLIIARELTDIVNNRKTSSLDEIAGRMNINTDYLVSLSSGNEKNISLNLLQQFISTEFIKVDGLLENLKNASNEEKKYLSGFRLYEDPSTLEKLQWITANGVNIDIVSTGIIAIINQVLWKKNQER